MSRFIPDGYCTIPSALEKVAKKEFPDRYREAFTSLEEAAALASHMAAKEELARYVTAAEEWDNAKRIALEKAKGVPPVSFSGGHKPRPSTPAELDRIFRQRGGSTRPYDVVAGMTPERLLLLKENAAETDAIRSIQRRLPAWIALLPEAWAKLRQSLWRGEISGFRWDGDTGQLKPVPAAQWGAAWADKMNWHLPEAENSLLLINSIELDSNLTGSLAKPRTDGAPEGPLRTGEPGRPTSRHLIEQEFGRRCQSGEVADQLSEESRLLADWLRDMHPEYPHTSPKTIQNNLRSAFNKYRKDAKRPKSA